MLFDESNDLLGLYVSLIFVFVLSVTCFSQGPEYECWGTMESFWELFDMQDMFIHCCMGVVDEELKSQLDLYSSSSMQCREVRDFILLSCCLRKRFLIGRWGPLLWLSQIWNQPMKACLSQFCPLADVECWLLWLDARWVGCSKVYNGDESCRT